MRYFQIHLRSVCHLNQSPFNVLQNLTMEKIEDNVVARMVGHMAMPINVNDKLMVRMAPDNQTFNSKINSIYRGTLY